MSEVTLRTGGGEYVGWKTVRISRSVEQATGEFTLEVTEKHQSDLLQHEFKINDRCQVLLGSKVVIDGYIELVEPSYDASSHTISLTGRDVTGDLTESSAELENGELTNVTIAQLAQALLKGYGISVQCPQPGAPFAKAVVNGGESVFDVLATHAGQRGLLLYTLGDGVLQIAKPAQTELGVHLQEGVNIKAASASHDASQQYGRYVFHAQGKDGKTIKHEITDQKGRPSRVLIQDLELAENSSLSTIQQRAAWELKVRQAKGQRASVTVVGWEYARGQLWNIGQRLRLSSPRLGYANSLMLISAVAYSLSDQEGTLTELTLINPEAYAPEPA